MGPRDVLWFGVAMLILVVALIALHTHGVI